MGCGDCDILLHAMELMTKPDKVLAVIPARGGSKGLRRKNIAPVGGKPLIAWTIQAAIKAECIDTVVVSSDDNEILKVAEDFGAESLLRPDELASDTAPIEPVIEEMGLKFEFLTLLQPTSPLRDSDEIDSAYEEIVSKAATALISVYEIDNKILKAFMMNDSGFLEGVSNCTFPFMRRQDLPNTYMSNGAIYFIKKDSFMQNKTLLTKNAVPYVMDIEKSLDIDSEEDLKRASEYIQLHCLK